MPSKTFVMLRKKLPDHFSELPLNISTMVQVLKSPWHTCGLHHDTVEQVVVPSKVPLVTQPGHHTICPRSSDPFYIVAY